MHKILIQIIFYLTNEYLILHFIQHVWQFSNFKLGRTLKWENAIKVFESSQYKYIYLHCAHRQRKRCSCASDRRDIKANKNYLNLHGLNYVLTSGRNDEYMIVLNTCLDLALSPFVCEGHTNNEEPLRSYINYQIAIIHVTRPYLQIRILLTYMYTITYRI